jgi:hypothetical protein
VFPTMEQSSAVRRPYLSDSRPIKGAAMACKREKSDPSAPPRSTISYRESIGFANEFLYALR